MEHDIEEANARLIRLREEAKSNREDSAYPLNINPRLAQMFPMQPSKKTLQESDSLQAGKKRVCYLYGIAAGLSHSLRADIADDLISRGVCKERL